MNWKVCQDIDPWWGGPSALELKDLSSKTGSTTCKLCAPEQATFLSEDSPRSALIQIPNGERFKPRLNKMLSLTCVLGPNGLAAGTGGCATVLQDGLLGQNVVLLAWRRIQKDQC